MSLRILSILFVIALVPKANAERPPNVLLLCIDDLRPELGCYGVDYIRTPHIDRLASEARVFDRHYVQAPTCGASRYTLLCGKYGPGDNDAIFKRIEGVSTPTMPEVFREAGYITVSVGKVTHHPGGYGGPNWNDESIVEMPNAWVRQVMPVGKWQHPRGAMHGLADGEIRVNAGEMDLFQSAEGYDDNFPDGLIAETAVRELDELAAASDTEPFFLAVGIIRPHLPFGAPAKYFAPYREATLPPIPHPEKPSGQSTWHGSGEFMKYHRWGRDPREDSEFATEVRRHYAACVSYADAMAGRLLSRLEELGIADNTIVLLWGDHGWHLGEHAVWGKHTLFEESLRSPLIIRAPGIAAKGERTEAIVETVDVFPTLCELAGLEVPDYADGESLVPLLKNADAEPGDNLAVSYRNEKLRTLRTDRYRLIEHPKDFVELYDHLSPDGETKNVADSNPEIVAELKAKLAEKMR